MDILEYKASVRKKIMAQSEINDVKMERIDFDASSIDDLISIATNLGASVDTKEKIQAEKTKKVEEDYMTSQMAGCDISLGFKMKCTFEDASVVRQAAEYLQRMGATTMTLKDVTGITHEEVPIATALTVADEMAGAYLTLWNVRETKKAQIRNAATIEELLAI